MHLRSDRGSNLLGRGPSRTGKGLRNLLQAIKDAAHWLGPLARRLLGQCSAKKAEGCCAGACSPLATHQGGEEASVESACSKCRRQLPGLVTQAERVGPRLWALICLGACACVHRAQHATADTSKFLWSVGSDGLFASRLKRARRPVHVLLTSPFRNFLHPSLINFEIVTGC